VALKVFEMSLILFVPVLSSHFSSTFSPSHMVSGWLSLHGHGP
jgi:hypothetical protein